MPEQTAIGRVGVMLLSAAIFGFFGFMMSWPELDVQTGKLIPLVVTLKWTLRITAIAFLICALVSMPLPDVGGLVYAAVGMACAAALAVLGVWDLTSHWYSGIHPFLLFVFAAWNGVTSWATYHNTRAAMVLRKSEAVA